MQIMVICLEEERIKDLFIDMFAFCTAGFISVFIGFAYILGILMGNTKMAKSREINLLLLMSHEYELQNGTPLWGAIGIIPAAPLTRL